MDHFIDATRSRAQQGQSVVEFAISITALATLLIAIPIVSKLGIAKLKTDQALNYVAWRVNKGINVNNPDELSREVGQRFFSRTGADVLTDRNAECDDAADQDSTGNSIVSWRSVAAGVSSSTEQYRDGLDLANSLGGFKLKHGQSLVSVHVPVSSIMGLAGVPQSMTLNSSLGTLSGTWSGRNAAEVRSTVMNSIPLMPYEKIQVPIVRIYNAVINNAVIKIENPIDIDIVKPDIVPSDRLTRYQ